MIDEWELERAEQRGADRGYYDGMMSSLPTQAEEKRRADQSRDRAIRAAVAAQWAVAMLVAWQPSNYECDVSTFWRSASGRGLVDALSALPTAEQIVDGTT